MTTTRFDLVTIDVVEPRAEAIWCNEQLGFVTLEEEDDGRWIVVGTADGARRLGFQRSTGREIKNRTPSRLTVGLDLAAVPPWASTHEAGPLAVVRVVDPEASAEFWSKTLGLQAGDVVELIRDPSPPATSIVHLDLACERADFDSELDRLYEFGASRVGPTRAEPWGTTQILTAPAGVIFCLNAY